MLSDYSSAPPVASSLPQMDKMEGGISWPQDWRATPIRQMWHARFSRLEPGLSLAEIARQLGTSKSVAYTWANVFRYRYPLTNARVDDWGQVDWRLSDAEIARRWHVSRERVRQVRSARGLPPSRGCGSPTRPYAERRP